MCASAAFAQPYSETIVHTFIPAPYGETPESSLIQASDGSLYGTTPDGGRFNAGTVFRIGNLAGTPSLSVLYSFTGGVDGNVPYASLIQASDGNLYGTTTRGGTSNAGTVFRVSNLAGTPAFGVIYAFTGGSDGDSPHSSLIQASDGDLYGTTIAGGSSFAGTVFRIGNLAGTPAESVLYSFTAGADGDSPNAALVQASDGNLYGTTLFGGTGDSGTVFRVSNLAGTPTFDVIYTFTGGADGGDPYSSLIQASDGSLYGTASQGGTGNAGTVFRIGNLAGTPTFGVTYAFAGGVDGNYPYASLIQALDGNLYGTTVQGGTSNFGTVFVIGNLSGIPAESVVYSFTGGTDGRDPFASLIQASDGNLYGTTPLGGASNVGTVFALGNLAGSPTFNVIYTFSNGADGNKPDALLLQASDGNLYGTTVSGGTGNLGTVFKISDLAGIPVESVLYGFTGGADGAGPYASLIEASDGNLYGTTAHGGTNQYGTVFRISNLAGSPVESVLYSFTGGADGGIPYASLIQASDGNLYGTTSGGGTSNTGTVFKVGNLSGLPTESVLYNFTGGADGGTPYASLIQASDGNLYGTTAYGGTFGHGTAFAIGNLAGPPSESVIYSFTGGADGGLPSGSLIQASNANLYGTTFGGGASSSGTVFQIVNPGGTPTFGVVYTFSGGADGRYPSGSLVQASDGNLYGTTTSGGTSGGGTVFTIGNLAGTPIFGVVYSFTGVADGYYPSAALIQATDGNLYGTTYSGGTFDAGTVFAMVKPCFNDVPASSPFRSFICTIARNGIAAGCGGGNFCPTSSVLRSQMAVFILRGEHGSAYVPPAANCGTYPFSDVACPNAFADFILQAYNEGITSGCATNPLIYCPDDPVSRAGMAVFLLVAEHGTGYAPPACAGIFTDVACPSAFADWIEQLYNEGITGGCTANPLQYCPGDPVTRAQMAVFLMATFNLQ